MSQAQRNAYDEYLRIQQMFKSGNPDAEIQWRKFVTADNGWSLASEIVTHPTQYGI